MASLKTRSLRVDILTTFGSLLIITLAVTIIYYYRTTSQIVLESSQDLMDLKTEQVMMETSNFLIPANIMGKMSARLATRETFRSLANNDRLERYTIELLHSYPQIEMVYIADEQGNLVLSNRQPDGTFATKILEKTGAPPKTLWRYRDHPLRVFKTETTELESYDPRRRPWYLGAKEAKKTYWTDIYIFYTGQKPGITCASPIVEGRNIPLSLNSPGWMSLPREQ